MQTETRIIAFVLLSVVLALFGAALLSTGKQRGALMSSAALGLAITNAFLRIGAKERTVR